MAEDLDAEFGGFQNRALRLEDTMSSRIRTQSLDGNYILRHQLGTFLVVQWMRLHAPNAVVLGSIPGWGTRSHVDATKIPTPCMLHGKVKVLWCN